MRRIGVLSVQDSAERWADLVAGTIISLILLLVVVDVAMRGLFKTGVPGLLELVEVMIPVVVFFGFASTEAAGAHISFTLVLGRFPLLWRKITEVFLRMAALVTFSAVTVQLGRAAWQAWQFGDYTAGSVPWPLFAPKMLIAFGSLAFCCRLISELVQAGPPSYWRRIRKGQE